MEERTLITYLFTGREQANVLASKDSSTMVVNQVKSTNTLAKVSNTKPLQSLIHWLVRSQALVA